MRTGGDASEKTETLPYKYELIWIHSNFSQANILKDGVNRNEKSSGFY